LRKLLNYFYKSLNQNLIDITSWTGDKEVKNE